MASELARLREENVRLQAELTAALQREERTKKLLKEALMQIRSLISLTMNWAYGPVFKRAGVLWPEGKCNAPAFVNAKRWIKNYDDNYD